MALLKPPTIPRFNSPTLGSDDDELRDQQRFEKRFGWLKGSLGATVDPLDGLASWSEYSADLARLRALQVSFTRLPTSFLADAPPRQPSAVIDEASGAYQAAVSAFTTFGSIPLAARGTLNKPEHQLRVCVARRR